MGRGCSRAMRWRIGGLARARACTAWEFVSPRACRSKRGGWLGRMGWGVVEINLEKIYNLTLNLLAYSKEREPGLELVNPRKIIEECVELIATPANTKGAMVVADVDRDMPPVPVDPDGIHQVLMNLLSNALDAVTSE